MIVEQDIRLTQIKVHVSMSSCVFFNFFSSGSLLQWFFFLYFFIYKMSHFELTNGLVYLWYVYYITGTICQAGFFSQAGMSMCPYTAENCPDGMGASGKVVPICVNKCEITDGSTANTISDVACACGVNACTNMTGLVCTEAGSLCSARRSACTSSAGMFDASACEIISERCECSKCKTNFHTAECIPCPPAAEGAVIVIIEMSIVLVCVYVFFCLLYYVFRSSASDNDEDNDASDEAEKKRNKAQRASRTGSSMGSVLVNQMQIVSLILGKMTWAPGLPKWVINIFYLVASAISIDFAGFFASPECLADMQPLGKWGVAMAIPWCILFCFVLWYLFARCHFASVTKQYDSHVVQTILHSAIYVSLTCLYTTVVKTCFRILDCTANIELDQNNNTINKPTYLIMDDRYECANIVGLQIAALAVFAFWAVFPFVAIFIVLCRSKMDGSLEDKLKNSTNFRHLFGWAVAKYRLNHPVAYLWEIVNAATKICMVAGSELMYRNNRELYHTMTAAASLLLHLVVRPYKDQVGNVVVCLFCAVELLGILSGENALLQVLFIIFILVTLLVVGSLAAAASHSVAKEMREHGHDVHHKHLTRLEFIMLTPMFLFMWPLKKLLMLLSLCDWCLSADDKKSKAKRRQKNQTSVVPFDSSSDKKDEDEEADNENVHTSGGKKEGEDAEDDSDDGDNDSDDDDTKQVTKEKHHKKHKKKKHKEKKDKHKKKHKKKKKNKNKHSDDDY
jgi:hypothetical protein